MAQGVHIRSNHGKRFRAKLSCYRPFRVLMSFAGLCLLWHRRVWINFFCYNLEAYERIHTGTVHSIISAWTFPFQMFGKHFWKNVVLEATHWNFGQDNVRQDMVLGTFSSGHMSLPYWYTIRGLPSHTVWNLITPRHIKYWYSLKVNLGYNNFFNGTCFNWFSWRKKGIRMEAKILNF
jgi:hypothetical protein